MDNDDQVIIKGDIKIDSKSLITKFKTIVKECDVDHKALLNYSLAGVEKKSINIIKKLRFDR